MPRQLTPVHLPMPFSAASVPLAPAPIAHTRTPRVRPTLTLTSNVVSARRAPVVHVLSNTQKAAYCLHRSTAAYLPMGHW